MARNHTICIDMTATVPNPTGTTAETRIAWLTIASAHTTRIGIGNLCIGTCFRELDRLDPKRETFEHYPHASHHPGSLLDNTVRCVQRDRRGNLWMGTNIGLNRLGFRAFCTIRQIRTASAIVM